MAEKHLKIPISQIMHRHVITADAYTSVRECAAKMADEHIGCLVVLSNNKPVGMITERNFVDAAKRGMFDANKIKALEFMSCPIIGIAPHTDYVTAMAIFDKKGVKRLPVISHDRLVGLLTLKSMMEFVNLSLAHQQKSLKMQAATDALTGLLNKAVITGEMRKEHDRVKRYGGRSSILFIDIDHFKNVNDKYSHIAGDVILKELGRLFKSLCRQIDTIGRFGGEEFLIIAPNRKKYQAIRFAERLRQSIEAHTFLFKGTRIPITVSIGVASLFEGRDFTDSLERADKALYHAKKMGRNRIGLWREGKLSIAVEHSGEHFQNHADVKNPAQ